MTCRAILRALPTIALLAIAPAAAEAAGDESPALHLEAGSVARHQIVAVGRDVTVEGSALAGVTALDGDARIVGEVAGDVVVVGGDVELAASGVVRGDVYVVGGELHAGSGSRIEGRSVAYPTVSRAWVTLLEGPSLGLSAVSPQVIAAKLALAAAWLALTLLLFAAGGRGVTTTSDEVRLEPWACFTSGLVAVLAITTSALVLSAPKNLVTVVIVFAGILSNAASEMGYVVLIPLAMVIFHSLGRHPFAGMAAAFAGVSGGYSANLVIGTIDPLLAGITQEAARLVDPGYSVHAAVNWYFMIASTFLITALGWFVTAKIVEMPPRIIACGRIAYKAVVRYEVISVERGSVTGKELLVVELCPEFRKLGETRKLRLRPVTRNDSFVDDFKSRQGPRYILSDLE